MDYLIVLDIILNFSTVFLLPFVVIYVLKKYFPKPISNNILAMIGVTLMFLMFYLTKMHRVSLLGYLDWVLMVLAKVIPSAFIAVQLHHYFFKHYGRWIFYLLFFILGAVLDN